MWKQKNQRDEEEQKEVMCYVKFLLIMHITIIVSVIVLGGMC